ncbi:MAG: hypothetical protein HY801_00765 [Candidatus Lindowbacteria bacterium]|nr:hypothetical protein [Candidatus Lindowbacteria bacterium]
MRTNPVDSRRPWFGHYDDNVPRSLDYPETTLYQLFDKSRREFASSTATIFYNSTRTYGNIGANIRDNPRPP